MIALIGFCSLSFAESPPANTSNVSTIDAPLPYQYLDWVTPNTNNLCGGMYSPPTLPSADVPLQEASIEIAADHYEAEGSGKATFEGNVIIQHGNIQLESDHIELDQKNQSTSMKGNVRIRQEGMLLTGREASFNLNDQNLNISHAEYVVHKSHVRGSAARISNDDKSVLQLENGSYTTCAPNANAWLFEASNLSLDNASGWGTATHATLKINDIPLFYLPWVMFPIDDRRQTGLLFPTFGEDDNGTNIALPLYLNIMPNADATLTFRNMTKRGSLIDGEFRYLLPFGEGQFGVSYLPDDKLTNTDRELTLFQHAGRFNNGWSMDIDYTHVSDEDYFADLKTTLSASAQTHLDQKAQLRYQGQYWSSSLLAQSYQTLDTLITDSSKPYRKLPQIRLKGHYSAFNEGFYLPVDFYWLTEFTQFEHPEHSIDGIQEAQRTHVSPRITVNLRRPWGYLKPTIQGYYTGYTLNGSADTFLSNIHDTTPETQTYTASMDSGLIFERSLAFNNRAMTQTLEPRLFYLYSPETNQDNNPILDSSLLSSNYNQLFRNNRFSGADRVGDAKQVSVGLTTRLINEAGLETFQASIGQSYYLQDRKTQLFSSTSSETETSSAIIGQITWPYNDALALYSEIQWDENRSKIIKTDVQIAYQNEKHQIVNIAYRQQNNDSDGINLENTLDQVDISTALTLTPHWSIASRWVYDINEKRTFDGLFGITYDNCCWAVQLMRRTYLKEESQASINNVNTDTNDMITRQGTYIQFQFKGLGGIGNALESILDSAVFGYEHRRKALSTHY